MHRRPKGPLWQGQQRQPFLQCGVGICKTAATRKHSCEVGLYRIIWTEVLHIFRKASNMHYLRVYVVAALVQVMSDVIGQASVVL